MLHMAVLGSHGLRVSADITCNGSLTSKVQNPQIGVLQNYQILSDSCGVSLERSRDVTNSIGNIVLDEQFKNKTVGFHTKTIIYMNYIA